MKYKVDILGLFDAAIEGSCGFMTLRESSEGDKLDTLLDSFFSEYPLSCGISLTIIRKGS